MSGRRSARAFDAMQLQLLFWLTIQATCAARARSSAAVQTAAPGTITTGVTHPSSAVTGRVNGGVPTCGGRVGRGGCTQRRKGGQSKASAGVASGTTKESAHAQGVHHCLCNVQGREYWRQSVDPSMLLWRMLRSE